MGKKIFSCMLFVALATLSVFTSCSKEEEIVPVEVRYSTANAEGILVPDEDVVAMNAAFQSAVVNAQLEGTTPASMAGTVKKHFRTELLKDLSAATIQTLKNSEMYFLIEVTRKDNGSKTSEAKLYGSEF